MVVIILGFVYHMKSRYDTKKTRDYLVSLEMESVQKRYDAELKNRLHAPHFALVGKARHAVTGGDLVRVVTTM